MVPPRIFIVFYFLSSLFHLATSEEGISSVKWKLDCRRQYQGGQCSQEIKRECPLNVNYKRLKEGPWTALTLTPVYNGSFNTTPESSNCVVEERWHPGLNIRWMQHVTERDTEYLLRILYVGKKLNESHVHCSQCIHVRVPGTSGLVQLEADQQEELTQTISLISNEVFHCQPTVRPNLLRVVVERLSEGGNVLEDRLEASIAFTLDVYGAKGLPIHLNRIVPRVDASSMDRFLNPRHWVTPLVIRNSSCIQEISVQFELMPPNTYVSKYTLSLFSNGLIVGDRIIYDQNEHREAEYGMASFRNLTVGMYLVVLSLETGGESCLTLMEPGVREEPTYEPCDQQHSWPSSCMMVSSGYHQINDCPDDLEKIAMPESRWDPTVAVIIGCVVVAITVLTVSLWFILYRRPGIAYLPATKQPETNDMVAKKTVYIMYCIDNQSHRDVVLKLSDLLQQEGHVNVILDAWTSSINSSMIDWVVTQQQQADTILLVGSEGASRYMEAHRMGVHWPLLEEAIPHSRIFPLAVKAVQQAQSMSLLRSNKMILVSFEYARSVKGMMKQLELLTCNNYHYHLPKDMENLLLHIHGTPRYSAGSWVRQWIKDVLTTSAGLSLMKVIKEAEKYHKDHPFWFREMYGDPIPFDENSAKQVSPEGDERESYKQFDAEAEVAALWKGPFQIAAESEMIQLPQLIPPEQCNVLHETENVEPPKSWDENKDQAESQVDQDALDSGIDIAPGTFPFLETSPHTTEPLNEVRRSRSSLEENEALLDHESGLDISRSDFHPPSSIDSTESVLMIPEFEDHVM